MSLSDAAWENQVPQHGGPRPSAGRKKKKRSDRKRARPHSSQRSLEQVPGEPSTAADGAAQQAGGASSKKRGQYFTFTYNVGKDRVLALSRVEAFATLVSTLSERSEIGFISVGHEIAPQTGEHHLQGYFETPKGVRISFPQFQQMFKIPSLDTTAWVVASRGSAEQNQKYTGKAIEEGRWYHCSGTYRNYGQGRSADMVAVQAKLDGGSSIVSIYKEYFETSAKHSRFFKEYALVTAKPRDWPMDIYYIYGPSGSGKSRWAQEFFPESDDVYWLPKAKQGGNVWWDGYQGQKIVVIDEFYPGYFGTGHVKFMLSLVDRYPLRVPVHGGQVMFSATTIVFTSNYPPSRIDSSDFSGYEWDATNPLFSRCYLREKPWVFMQIGRYQFNDPMCDEVGPRVFPLIGGASHVSASINLNP